MGGIVTEIFLDNSALRLSKISLIEIIGLGNKLAPIYSIKSKVKGFLDIPIDTIVHWEDAPASLQLES